MTSLAIAFGTAVAGMLINLGGDSTLDAARYTLFGLGIICASGALTAHAANRTSRTDPAATPIFHGPHDACSMNHEAAHEP
ncbi:hypothetical protein [Nonomuraea sp. B5E05]|uniref:hypothetical protein n=1 Tax=Nonomuraea sp. B5E05 TaxID=3153569 RepID=UPI0032601F03